MKTFKVTLRGGNTELIKADSYDYHRESDYVQFVNRDTKYVYFDPKEKNILDILHKHHYYGLYKSETSVELIAEIKQDSVISIITLKGKEKKNA